MITQNIHVRMDAYGIQPVIHAVEGDTWRYLDIYTDDAAINTSNTAAVAIHRPDNSYYTISATPNPGGFYHLEMDQALTRPGKVECQLKVSSGDLVISTYTFYVIVEPSTTGLPVEQLGYDIYDLIEAAETITPSPGLTDDIKQALLDCFEHVAWTDEHGQDYVDALEAALYPPANLVSISAVYTQSGTVYDTDTLDSLRDDLVVTAHYDNGTSEVVTTYTLSGTLAEGTSTITVAYGGKTATFTVAVTEYPSYSITYNLTNVASSNDAVKVAQGDPYTTTLSYDDTQYMLSTLSVTMGGTDITSSVYGDGVVQINEVTGNVVITATASQIVTNQAIVRQVGSNARYYDAGGTQIGGGAYQYYGYVTETASADSTATITITNNGESAVGANTKIYAGETDQYDTTQIVEFHNSVLAFTIPSVGIAPGGNITFTATVHRGYRLGFTCLANCSVTVKGIANDVITYSNTYAYTISDAASTSHYYAGGDTSTADTTKYYAKNKITTEAFTEDTVVTVIFENKADTSTGDVSGGERLFSCATAATGGSAFFWKEEPSSAGNQSLPGYGYARYTYTVKAGYYFAIKSSSASQLSADYSVTIVKGNLR